MLALLSTHSHIHNIHPCTNPPSPSQVDAEEICSILQQAFQLVYTEATVQHLNESISAGERGSVVAAPTATTPQQRQDKPAQETGQKQPEAKNVSHNSELVLNKTVPIKSSSSIYTLSTHSNQTCTAYPQLQTRTKYPAPPASSSHSCLYTLAYMLNLCM